MKPQRTPMRFGCVGERLGHSFSAEIHRRLTGEDYFLCELAPGELESFFRARAFRGVNVTIPYKSAVIPFLDETDPCARLIGAVNTVVNRDGKLYGYNTDYEGMRALAEREKISFAGKTVAILGTGGTSRTARVLAKDSGAAKIYTVSRTGREGALTYPELDLLADGIDVIVNTTPSGMDPDTFGCPVEVSRFPRLSGVLDAVYHPLRTRLVTGALARGIPACGGLYMLTAQAVRAAELFRDVVYPSGTTERIYREILEEKENIVLCGMPGCGKTTVGKLLAERTHRPFFDLDERIAAVTGRTPGEIIRADGEDAFRSTESRVLRDELAAKTGTVIATGGGTVLSDENLSALRQNGKLFFLDRPPELLIPTADRPLSGTRELLERRYRERYGRYLAAADVTVPASGTPESVADALTEARKRFFE